MKRFILAAFAALSLSSCSSLTNLNTEVTPARCEAVLKGVSRVETIAQFLISRGIEARLAQEVAEFVADGRITIQQVCDAVNGIPPEPEPEQPLTL